MIMRRLWLISTDHQEEELWFRDDEDFKVGMNYVAIQASCCPEVSVLSFILMSNHVHFVLKGERWDVKDFIEQFKQRYSLYMRHRWGIKEFLRGNWVQIKEISDTDEDLERAIAYVQMNCVAANICAHPSQYPFGTGNSFFNTVRSTTDVVKQGWKRLGDLSTRARGSMLHSNYDNLPDDWHIGPDGFILPQDYVDVKAVEEVFHTPRRMNYFLQSSSKARKRLESEEHLPAFRDQIILAALPDLYRSLFGKYSFKELNPDEQTECMRQIRFRFSADVNQIARVCGVSYAEAARIMDRA